MRRSGSNRADRTRRVVWFARPVPADAGLKVLVALQREGDRVTPGWGRPVGLSRGPTNDGRPGIDLLAPGATPADASRSFSGTSAVAAYTGGVVALLHEVDQALTPAETEFVLEATAAPVPEHGTLTAGEGLLDADDAIVCARNATWS
jgi:hypothetical protein